MKLRDWPKLALVFIGLMFLASAIAYPTLPARIPTHWGLNGVDAWKAKSPEAVLEIPFVALGLYLLLVIIPYFDPKRANLLKSKGVYNLVVDAVVALQLLIHVASLAAAYRPELPVDRVILAAIALMFLVLGNFMGKVKQNWTMGARMSWTLEDEYVWKRTNRLTGMLFVGCGVIAFFGAFLPAPWHVAALLGPVLLVLPIVYGYAFLLYRKRHPQSA